MKKRYLGLRLLYSCFLFLLLLPLIMTLIYSLCSQEEIRAFLQTSGRYQSELMEIKLIPRMFSLTQYWDFLIVSSANLRFYMNSIALTTVILLGQLLIVPATAYGLSRFRFRGRDILVMIIVALLLLPFQVTMVPTVLMLRQMNMLDTIWAMILPNLASPLYIFLLRQAMLTIPNELFEAGQLDGAGTIRCYLHVALPVSRSMIGAFLALSFADCWNMIEQPMVYLPTNQRLMPLSIAFRNLSEEQLGICFAGATLYIIPAFMVYMFFQEDIISSIQLSGLK